jgi:hypothetical protein
MEDLMPFPELIDSENDSPEKQSNELRPWG